MKYHIFFFSKIQEDVIKFVFCCSRNWRFKGLNVNSQYEPRHEISNNVVCATSKDSDQPGHTRSLIRAFASGLNIL